jgi:hypothetical protein
MRRVELLFLMSPGNPSNQKSIQGADWQLFDGTLYVDFGRTGADGKVTVELAPGRTYQLEILGSVYELTLRGAAIEPVTQRRGQQRRLRMLGYHLGHGGPDGNGVDNIMGSSTHRAILDVQTDSGIAITGNANANTRTQLTNQAGM